MDIGEEKSGLRKIPGAKESTEGALTGRLTDDEDMLSAVFKDCSDIMFHPFQTMSGTSFLCVYCQGLCDTERLERQVLAPLEAGETGVLDVSAERSSRYVYARDNKLQEAPVASLEVIHSLEQAVQGILDGQALVIKEGTSAAVLYSLHKSLSRTPEEPAAESTVRGARDGFTESLQMNSSLLRMRLKTPSFKQWVLTMGSSTNTKVLLVYIEGVIKPSLLNEVRDRLQRLNISKVLESQNIEEGIIDQRFSPFPQMLATERPDVVVSNLLEGRFAILIEGTPFTLIAPVTLFTMLQSPEDYYQNMYMSVFVRWLRYLFFMLSLLLPSAYVAVTTFHQEMIPTVLLLSIARAREEIPFPALIEALIMELSFEALREAGVRLPRQVGSAVSIVGALIIGQAATSAGIVSAPMIIIVAITGIASFMIPRYAMSTSTRLLRFPIMLLAGTMGLTGVMLGLIVIVIHLSSLRSFGTPYLAPITPSSAEGMKDVWWRSPPWRRAR